MPRLLISRRRSAASARRSAPPPPRNPLTPPARSSSRTARPCRSQSPSTTPDLGAFFGPERQGRRADGDRAATRVDPRLRESRSTHSTRPCSGGSAQSLADNAATATAVVSDAPERGRDRPPVLARKPLPGSRPIRPPGPRHDQRQHHRFGVRRSPGPDRLQPPPPRSPNPAFTDTWYPLAQDAPQRPAAGGAASKPASALLRATSPISTTTPPYPCS